MSFALLKSDGHDKCVQVPIFAVFFFDTIFNFGDRGMNDRLFLFAYTRREKRLRRKLDLKFFASSQRDGEILISEEIINLPTIVYDSLIAESVQIIQKM